MSEKTKTIPFDLDKAKQGAKVVTRGGCSARIVDYKVNDENYPILGLINKENNEIPKKFTVDGKYYLTMDDALDLFIEEEVEEEVEETDDYNPYKEVVKSIADMVERYSAFGSDLVDFYDNVKVKCREAFEYEKKWNKEQDEQEAKVKPKFKVGDVMRLLVEAEDDITEGLPVVVSIDNTRYHCTNETIYIKDQEDYEYPPMNRFVLPNGWYTCIKSRATVNMKIGDWFEEGHYYLGSNILKYKGLLEKDEDFKDYFHPWNISDAKDGDVLMSGEVIFIFNKIDGEWLHCYCSCHKDGSFIRDYDLMTAEYFNEVYPATIEQRDLLFQKMKEEGYEWDSNKNELHKMGEKVKTHRMTNQELADWLRDCTEEHREWKYTSGDIAYSHYCYPESEAFKPVKTILIRRNHGSWQEPLVEL